MGTLGISRPTLREAFRILEAENLISVIRGSRSGARVHNPSPALVSRYAGYVLESQGTTIGDLYAARLAIEPTVVGWLANGVDVALGLAGLKQLLVELEDMLASGHHDAFVENLSHFHQMLVEATGNKTLSLMNRMLSSLWHTHQTDYLRRNPGSRDDWPTMLRDRFTSYGTLIAMIEAGDADGAETHWRLHLRHSNEIWATGVEGDRIVDSLPA